MSKLTDQVKKQIKKDHIKPRSQFNVLAEQFGYAFLFLIFFTTLILSFNWFGFWLRSTGNAVFLGHGLFGLGIFIKSFPLVLVLIVGLAFGLTVLLLRHYDISYKQPMLLMSVGLLVLAILIGGGLSRLRINDRIAEQVEMGQLRPLRPLYENRQNFSLFTERAVVGRVKSFTDQEILVEAPECEVVITIKAGTKINDEDLLKAGSMIHAIGRRIGSGQFEAEVVFVRPKLSDKSERKVYLGV
ncbi:hypothetical protein KC644_03440 [Candidatus Berkelbacteria bacterium]|nr:hypothetical protein [Candidatus Berkelbacteria bacterium]